MLYTRVTMFTGIIEDISTLVSIEKEGTNIHFTFQNPVTNELYVDQSVSHDGVCLTITHTHPESNQYKVTAIQETLNRTNLSHWEVGYAANIERCMPAHGRFDGHIVQGHVDTIGIVDEIHDLNGSHLIFVTYPTTTGITVTKGSITINGVSLTVVDSLEGAFSVAIIPHTWSKTNLGNLKVGDSVNLEFDILGKYIQRMLKAQL